MTCVSGAAARHLLVVKEQIAHYQHQSYLQLHSYSIILLRGCPTQTISYWHQARCILHCEKGV